MLKRLILRVLFRLRSFMQEEIIAELRAEMAHLRFDHEQLRASLTRLEQFDDTAKAVEDGLLSLALHKAETSLPDKTTYTGV